MHLFYLYSSLYMLITQAFITLLYFPFLGIEILAVDHNAAIRM